MCIKYIGKIIIVKICAVQRIPFLRRSANLPARSTEKILKNLRRFSSGKNSAKISKIKSAKKIENFLDKSAKTCKQFYCETLQIILGIINSVYAIITNRLYFIKNISYIYM